VSIPGVKRLGPGADHSPPPSAEVKEKVELHPYFLYVLMWQLTRHIYLYLYITFVVKTRYVVERNEVSIPFSNWLHVLYRMYI
jgi:hypothetical protein